MQLAPTSYDDIGRQVERGLYRTQVRRRAVQPPGPGAGRGYNRQLYEAFAPRSARGVEVGVQDRRDQSDRRAGVERDRQDAVGLSVGKGLERSEEHTSELQSLMRISYAVFCLKKTQTTNQHT